jgi:very-short-patch-repair endonuclease
LTKNKIIPYKPYLKAFARDLRKNSTKAEILLWQQIKNRRLSYQFHRQVPMDQYIVDFYCHELMMAIEVDGISHDSEEACISDRNRQHRLEQFGVKFLRIDDSDIMKSIENVIKSIELFIEELER